MRIAPLLQIGRGVTAIIGGGGKTTLLGVLARELSPRGTVLLCTSTHIRRPADVPVLTAAAEADVRAGFGTHRVLCLGEGTPEGKLTAPLLPFDVLATLADYVLVEADGARGLPLKAHAPHEPVIPENACRVVLVLGADGFGRPIRAACHRPELYAKQAQAALDEIVTPTLAARVLLAEGWGDRVYVNKVESAEGYAAAEALHSLLPCPVTAGSLHQGVYTTWH